MRLRLYGGFGEKGRTSIGVESGGFRLLLDAGVKTSARGTPEYYPSIAPGELRALDAVLLTHAHEDHVAALGWCIANGFAGRVYATAETRRELAACLDGYAEPAHAALVRHAEIRELPIGDPALSLGPLQVSTGRSGHIAGGVWSLVDDGNVRFCYCSDIVPASPVFEMDPLPACHAMALDASYGDDAIPGAERARAIAAWIATRPSGCILPTPLYGRSAELLAIVPPPLALAPGMRDALVAQIADRRWISDCAATVLADRLAQARDWHEADTLPATPLLCHDGMGLSGPSQAILRHAMVERHPCLFTGHVPAGSPGAVMLEAGAAHWIRLPTHPTLADNLALAAGTGAATLLGHSCEADALARLASHLRGLRTDLRTGHHVDI